MDLPDAAKDKNAFDTATREFREEVGIDFPLQRNQVTKFTYHGHTNIYIGFSNFKIPAHILNTPNNEVAEKKLPKWKDVFDYTLVSHVKKSLCALVESGNLSVPNKFYENCKK